RVELGQESILAATRGASESRHGREGWRIGIAANEGVSGRVDRDGLAAGGQRQAAEVTGVDEAAPAAHFGHEGSRSCGGKGRLEGAGRNRKVPGRRAAGDIGVSRPVYCYPTPNILAPAAEINRVH